MKEREFFTLNTKMTIFLNPLFQRLMLFEYPHWRALIQTTNQFHHVITTTTWATLCLIQAFTLYLQRWAVDKNVAACETFKLNHPETEVRNETVEDFLQLIRGWKTLCVKYCEPKDLKSRASRNCFVKVKDDQVGTQNEGELAFDSDIPEDEYEVNKIVGIRYIKPTSKGKSGLELRVHWNGYHESEDTWESLEGLGHCEERLKEFILQGHKVKILPLPGEIDVICGGPPCQGASGFNRYRNNEAPFDDYKNHQLVVFMEIVEFLKPRYVLLENVVDVIKWSESLLGRYALSRLVQMHYQAKLGIMVAGCYGLAQFRMRVFFWGVHPKENLPQFPLPTHDVILRGGIPREWERNVVAYEASKRPKLKPAVVLKDAISDLPLITQFKQEEKMAYRNPPQTEFQKYIRLRKEDAGNQISSRMKLYNQTLHDHQCLQLNVNDYERVCRIPKRKGANFRDLGGVIVHPNNTCPVIDTSVERTLLPSGKPLVPDHVISYCRGHGTSRPYGRLWWDETVPTVITRVEPYNQANLHPQQDRVLSIRENARLQGFPDYYRLCGTIKDKYIQVGNAVAMPVAMALGYSMGLAIKDMFMTKETVMELPRNFPYDCLIAHRNAHHSDRKDS